MTKLAYSRNKKNDLNQRNLLKKKVKEKFQAPFPQDPSPYFPARVQGLIKNTDVCVGKEIGCLIISFPLPVVCSMPPPPI